ncbi:DUF547 domain-containing protein [Sneathiella sp. P13V-1]|uniref:DUF547 domain-containing protein n=1 Tax=Sneathiella sp. P13V-1 TaxID=2697366 RepID=UPI00187BAD62|nr:DUF547 domain-containing protein [Sneathiella sp. P13V-1]MBE7636057.1 DUF547 domain-containing protein [Sneathiella sp. P13V-1]
MMNVTRVPVLTLLAAIFVGLANLSFAAPASELIPRWDAHDQNSKTVVNHSKLDQFLAKYRYVGDDGVARLHYNHVTPEDRNLLNGYVSDLEAVPVSKLNRAEQYAYWVNLYNSGTIKVILDHFPVPTIKDINISPGFFSVGPWGKQFLKVEGEAVSLDNIEHGILRPIWKDPRTHYVVNCASIGCPDIPEKALTAHNTEQTHEKAARAYVNNPRGVRVTESGDVYASSIYDWFSSDFGNSEADTLDHIRKYAAEDLKSRLEGKSEIEGYNYNWSLNGDPKPNG